MQATGKDFGGLTVLTSREKEIISLLAAKLDVNINFDGSAIEIIIENLLQALSQKKLRLKDIHEICGIRILKSICKKVMVPMYLFPKHLRHTFLLSGFRNTITHRYKPGMFDFSGTVS